MASNQNPMGDANAYTQFRPEDIPNYWELAQRFVLSDSFFASAQGASFPNHLYSIAATSGGVHDSPQRPELAARASIQAGYAKSWGCDSAEGSSVRVYDREGVAVEVPPCFDFLTEGDLLSRHDIPWAYTPPRTSRAATSGPRTTPCVATAPTRSGGSSTCVRSTT